jgi:hypothetical protein
MEGHEPLIPRELHHYDLHVWLFKAMNGDADDDALWGGLFKATNRTVSCSGKSGYALMEGPPKLVSHPSH